MREGEQEMGELEGEVLWLVIAAMIFKRDWFTTPTITFEMAKEDQ